MSPKFGTSGLRGLVSELTSDLVKRHILAFLEACDTGDTVCVGRDLRASSDRIMADVIAAITSTGRTAHDCGALPTPALALAAQEAGASAVMVTGSHIPADRNGLKFYSRQGEITKEDEAAIRSHLDSTTPEPAAQGSIHVDRTAADRFADRYLDAFPSDALAGRRIGLYAHSAVGRALLADILAGLGAEVVTLGWSETFVPVDTEAVDPDTRAQLQDWVVTHKLDALVSTDGDSDRPLLIDDEGLQVPGDILGQICAEALGAETVVTPVSSNSGVQQKGFHKVILTRIGSPFVISGMQEADGNVVGYEANGGFLLGFAARTDNAVLAPLLTRDCVLPLVVPLIAAKGGTVSKRVKSEPAVTTAADRLQDVPSATSQALIARFTDSAEDRHRFLEGLGETEDALDLTDGLRLSLTGGSVLHIRPSGNAPELRIYTEAPDRAAAMALLDKARAALRRATEAGMQTDPKGIV